MANVDTLQALFVEELRDLLDAEKQLVRTLPKLARKVTSESLAAALQEHLEQTRGHVDRLGQVFERIGTRASAKKCVGMQGLIEDGDESIQEAEDGPVRDAAIIAAAQRAEHYEMAGYGTARTYASLLGHTAAASLLEQTLDEEKAADAKLTGIAEGLVNPEAAAEPRSSDERSFAARTAEWLGSTAGAAAGQVGRLAGRFTGGRARTGAAAQSSARSGGSRRAGARRMAGSRSGARRATSRSRRATAGSRTSRKK